MNEALSRLETAVSLDAKGKAEQAKQILDAGKAIKILHDAKTLSRQIEALNDLAKIGSEKFNPASFAIDMIREKQTEVAISEAKKLIALGDSVQNRFQAEFEVLHGMSNRNQNQGELSGSTIANMIDNMNPEQIANHFTNQVESMRQQQGDAAANAEEARIHQEIQNAARGKNRAEQLLKK